MNVVMARRAASRCREQPRAPFSREELDDLLDLAAGGIDQLGAAQREAVEVRACLS